MKNRCNIDAQQRKNYLDWGWVLGQDNRLDAAVDAHAVLDAPAAVDAPAGSNRSDPRCLIQRWNRLRVALATSPRDMQKVPRPIATGESRAAAKSTAKPPRRRRRHCRRPRRHAPCSSVPLSPAPSAPTPAALESR